jgi:hypothetical protein
MKNKNEIFTIPDELVNLDEPTILDDSDLLLRREGESREDVRKRVIKFAMEKYGINLDKVTAQELEQKYNKDKFGARSDKFKLSED